MTIQKSALVARKWMSLDHVNSTALALHLHLCKGDLPLREAVCIGSVRHRPTYLARRWTGLGCWWVPISGFLATRESLSVGSLHARSRGQKRGLRG
jgi:hypothetical protein